MKCRYVLGVIMMVVVRKKPTFKSKTDIVVMNWKILKDMLFFHGEIIGPLILISVESQSLTKRVRQVFLC